MNYKRTFLDSVNAGRPRRQSASIEDLDRTLETLEGRVGRLRDEAYGSESARPWRDVPWRERDQRASPQPYREMARDLERVRAHEDELSSVSRIAAEIKSLREELRHQMSTGIGREFATLRRDLERATAASATNSQAAALGAEFERLSAMIQRLADNGGDKSVSLLRLEIDEVKKALDTLAREDTVRSVGERWEEFDRRWDVLAADLRNAGAGQGGDGYGAIEERLDAIQRAVSALPESLSLQSLEDKLRNLGGVVDALNRQQDRFPPEALDSIERRLDELSRAVVASATVARSSQFDPEPLERIEARIGALARQIDEVANSRNDGDIADQIHSVGQRLDDLAHRVRLPEEAVERLARQIDEIAGSRLDSEISGHIQSISHRVDDLAQRVQLPEDAVERLARQIAIISQKLDTVPAAPDMEPVFRDIDERFQELSRRFDERHGDTLEQGQTLFRDLGKRIEAMAAQVSAQAEASDVSIVEAMERRFSELARQLDTQARPEIGESAIANLEDRLEDISARLQATQESAIDPALIRSLQAQVTALSEQMMRPHEPLPEFEELGPRLDHIERSIFETRERLFDAARMAAEEAVRSLAGTQDAGLAADLSQELRSLEHLTRASDDRNAKTFEAIHDTLIKIVDRLASMERRQPASQPAQPVASQPLPPLAEQRPPVLDQPVRETIDSPSIAPEIAAEERTPPPRTAADAASAAAAAALSGDPSSEAEEPASRSLLGGITRAFRPKRKDTAESAEAATPRHELNLDEPIDPKVANQPLEPGSGAPDLNAIMRRVRDQRGTRSGGDADAAKSDFIAAARRAAQAAAAEAEITKGKTGDPTAAPRTGLARFLPGKKPIVMGLAAILLAGSAWQLTTAFMAEDPAAGGQPTASAEEEAAPALVAEAMPQEEEAPSVQAAMEPRQAAPVARAVAFDMASRPPEQREPSRFEPLDAEASGPAAADRMEMAALPAPATIEEGPDRIAAGPLVDVPDEAGPLALREAAASGNPAALFELGNRYAEGYGVELDMEKAAEWYEMAAEMGLAPAQYRIGSLYEKGIGVERDMHSARTWYQLAAEQGNASAMHNLGVLFAMGADGVADNDSAARWFLQAAEFGVRDSQFNMGILAGRGIGMRQDLGESYKWFALVAQGGDQDAATKRDEVAALLSAEDLERAQAAVELWRARTPDAATNLVDIPDEWLDEPATRSAASTPTTTASIGQTDVRAAVADVQRILNAAGYDAGTVDGLMGQKTGNAIRAFQRDNGMAETGQIDRALVEKLLERAG